MKRTYADAIARLKAQHGDKFREPTGIDPAIIHAFGHRVEVVGKDGEPRRGIVSITTGWWPALMLLKRRDSRGSSDLIGQDDVLLRDFGHVER